MSNIKKNKLLFKSGDDWTFPLLEEIEKHCAEIAFEELKLDIFPNQIEIINYEQMLDIYTSIGLPVMYKHWSFGKKFLQNEILYKKGVQGLAFEIVINTNPCITYLMETNNATLQLITIAHASFGHNHFFKNNYMFKEWTQPESIIDYIIFARNFIEDCEEKYGYENVEKILDMCHSLANYGIFKYKKPKKLNIKEEIKKIEKRKEDLRKNVNEFWDTLIKQKKENDVNTENDFLFFDEENILYFLEKKSPILEDWQREICRIIRKINEYLYPQMHTKIMNEGFASFVHNYIIRRLYEKNLIDDGTMLEYLNINTSVLKWYHFDEFGFNSRFNPYSLGFSIFDEIKRICEGNITEEDKIYSKNLIGQNWLDVFHDCVANYRDESFIMQFLTPNLVKKYRMFNVFDDENLSNYVVSKIHNDNGFYTIKENLSNMFNVNYHIPNIKVEKVNFKGDRILYLQHIRYNNMTLNKNVLKVLENIKKLWGFKVILNSIDIYDKNKIITYSTSD